MRIIGRLILLALMVVVGVLFVRKWHQTTPLGYGTGYYAGKSSDNAVGKGTSDARSRLKNVAENPGQYDGQRLTLTGRVRQSAKYASNRNIYTLTTPDESSRVIVIDDKAPPQEYYHRTVTGVLQKIPGTNSYYLVDVNSKTRLAPPSGAQVETLLKSKLNAARQSAEKGFSQAKNAATNAVR